MAKALRKLGWFEWSTVVVMIVAVAIWIVIHSLLGWATWYDYP